MIDALETCNVDQNKAFIKDVLRSALNSILLLILEDESGIRESFESAIFQVATSVKAVSKIGKAIMTDAVVLAPIAMFSVKAVKSKVV